MRLDEAPSQSTRFFAWCSGADPGVSGATTARATRTAASLHEQRHVLVGPAVAAFRSSVVPALGPARGVRVLMADAVLGGALLRLLFDVGLSGADPATGPRRFGLR